jgi:hypothetical protein
MYLITIRLTTILARLSPAISAPEAPKANR